MANELSDSKKILIIEDSDSKYEWLKEALDMVLDMPEITRAISRNGGYNTIREQYSSGNYYDLIICDNYMPKYNDQHQLQPFAKDIINYIRRNVSTDVPICVCSSEELDFDCSEHFIKWDYNMTIESFENDIKQILGIYVRN